MVKFLETNQKLCGVPPNDHHAGARPTTPRPMQIRNKSAARAAGAARGPSLSDALGGPIIADDEPPKPGRGTFDTLTGNALQR